MDTTDIACPMSQLSLAYGRHDHHLSMEDIYFSCPLKTQSSLVYGRHDHYLSSHVYINKYNPIFCNLFSIRVTNTQKVLGTDEKNLWPDNVNKDIIYFLVHWFQ